MIGSMIGSNSCILVSLICCLFLSFYITIKGLTVRAKQLAMAVSRSEHEINSLIHCLRLDVLDHGS